MTRFLIVLFLIMLISSVVFSQELDLKVTAVLKEDTIVLFHDNPVFVGENSLGQLRLGAGQFDLETTITNVSNKRQEIYAWQCDYERQWETDLFHIDLTPVQCSQNAREEIILDPGEKYIRTIRLIALNTLPYGEHTFRIGYKYGYGKIWSLPIKLNVQFAEESRREEWAKLAVYKEAFERQEHHLPFYEGVAKRYYFTGELFDERMVKNGKLDGPVKIYYKSGEIKVEKNFKDGKLDGNVNYYSENGQLVKTALYQEDILLEVKEFDEEGNEKKANKQEKSFMGFSFKNLFGF